ncbi:MAG: hypothetical protein JXA09_05160 [Anaerolineae bacterium]|nr:hypothetical protein [Anaerolineae bacterium]
MRRRRSQWLWIAVGWFAILGVSAAWRGLALWGERALLYELGSSLSPLALTVYAAIFVGCGLGLVVAAAGLWFRRDWSRHVAWACLAGYLAASQSYTWLYVRSGLTWERRWVALTGAVLALAVSVVAMTCSRPRAWLGLG